MNKSSNPKHQQILQTGRELFWKFGFRRVTIEEICREAGVSKMTFYKFFPNKLELATSILDEVFEESLIKIQRLRDEHETPEKTLKKILIMKAEGVHGISQEFIKDLYANPEESIKTYMEERSAHIFAEIAKVYEQGKEDGWIRKDLNVPFLIQYIQKAIDFFSNDEMLHYFDSPGEMVMEITNLFVYGISPHK